MKDDEPFVAPSVEEPVPCWGELPEPKPKPCRFTFRLDNTLETYVREQAIERGCTTASIVRTALRNEMAEGKMMRHRAAPGRTKLCQKCGGPNITWRESQRCPQCPTPEQDQVRQMEYRILECALQSAELERGTGCIEPHEQIMYGRNRVGRNYTYRGKDAGGESIPRLAWEARYGRLLFNERLWRKCENRRCVNAEHMRVYKRA